MPDDAQLTAVEYATELTIAWLGNQHNRVAAEDVPGFLQTMHATVTALASGAPTSSDDIAGDTERTDHAPAVSARKSLASKDHIISMIDGKPYKTLRRHLNTHGMTPEEYRARYNLKADYPMVAENYSQARREMAMKIGLGSKGRQSRATDGSASTDPAPRKRVKAAD